MKRPCIGPQGTGGCGALIPRGTTRCPPCARTADKARGSRQSRGYAAAHDRHRRAWVPLVARGGIRCAKCGLPIAAGQPWDLGHDDDREHWTGPEHAHCNRSAAGRHSRD